MDPEDWMEKQDRRAVWLGWVIVGATLVVLALLIVGAFEAFR